MKDKSAILNSAQKYASKGQLDKAIAEWEKLLDDGKDGNVHNTIGDLYLKKGDERQAIEHFSIAAELFKKDGFFPKAIAIYKKILHIEPGAVDSLISLAMLNAEKGLIGNAIDNYFKAAEIFKRDGLTEKATTVVERIIQLSPNDINTRMKIADLYMRIGARERAANEYASIGSDYAENNDIDKARELYLKANEIAPDNIQVLVGLSRIAEKTDNIEQALEYLEKATSYDPNHKETLLQYAALAMNINKTDEARNILIKLNEIYPDDLYVRKTLGTFYISEGVLDQAWDALQPYLDNVINEQKWAEARELLDGLRELNTAALKKRIIDVLRGTGDELNLLAEMKELALLQKEEGAYNEALQMYRDALEISPDDQGLIKEIKALESTLGVTSNVDEASESEISAPGDNLLTPSELLRERVLSLNEEAVTSQTDHAADDPISSDDLRGEGNMPRDSATMSAEEFAEKKSEAEFYAQQGITDEAIKIYEMLASSAPDNDEIRKELGALRNTSTHTDEIFVEKINEDAITEKKDDTEDLRKIFDRFDHNEKEEYDVHYKTGMDLKDKGQIDGAIQELQIAAKDPENRARNRRALASCYLEKGNYPLAVSELAGVAEEISPADERYMDIKYELANAYECNKDYNKALEQYSDIQAKDPGFKDVSRKIEDIKTQKRDDTDNPKARKDRVSYI